MGALSRAQAVFKSSWGRSGEHKLCSRVNGGVKESTSCVQGLMGALLCARVHGGVKESPSCGLEFMGGVKESTSCVQEFIKESTSWAFMGALRRAQAVFKS